MFTITLHNAVRDELAGLPPIVQAKMVPLIDKLQPNATALREPDSKPLANGLFELRTMGTEIARDCMPIKKADVFSVKSVY